MFLTLREILDSDVFAAGSPTIVAGHEAVDTARVRWVHSSEILEIAPLLSGGELLLSGGQALLALKASAQVSYIDSLVSRKIAALAIETAATGRHLPESLVAAAEAAQLPLIELRDVVPFVEVAEAMNRKIVTSQLGSLQVADELSRALTEQIATSGTQLQPLLHLISTTLLVHARVVDDHGSVVAASGPDPNPDDIFAIAELPVGGVPVAQLELYGGTDAELLTTVLSRVRSIVALAISQRYRPSLAKLAEEELLRTIWSGGGGDRLVELSQAAGISADTPVLVVVLRRGEQAPQPMQKTLRERFAGAVVHLDDTWITALLPMPAEHPNVIREKILQQLRSLAHSTGFTGALGPTATTIRQASKALTEAQATWRLGHSSKWRDEIYDASDFLVERLAEQTLSRSEVNTLIEEALGELIRLEAQHGGELVRTLDVWLSTGCNTTEAARLLFLERQSLHKRLNRIFPALGGDPRGRGKLSGLTLAVKLMRGNARLLEDA